MRWLETKRWKGGGGEWERVHSQSRHRLSWRDKAPKVNSKGTPIQMGASKSTFPNSLDPLGFLLINTTVTLKTSVNAFAFQLFLLIFGCRTAIFSGSSLGSLFKLYSCCYPTLLVSLRSEFPLLERFLSTQNYGMLARTLAGFLFTVVPFPVVSFLINNLSSTIDTSSWDGSAQLLFFAREGSIKKTQEPKLIITTLIIITSSFLLCPRSQNLEVGHQKGSLLKFLKMLY